LPVCGSTGVPAVINNIYQSAVPAKNYLTEQRSASFRHHHTPAYKANCCASLCCKLPCPKIATTNHDNKKPVQQCVIYTVWYISVGRGLEASIDWWPEWVELGWKRNGAYFSALRASKGFTAKVEGLWCRSDWMWVMDWTGLGRQVCELGLGWIGSSQMNPCPTLWLTHHKLGSEPEPTLHTPWHRE